MKSSVKTYVFWIGLALGTGVLAGFLTREATQMYSELLSKPPLSPPAALFPVVWTILYVLMGISAARVWLSKDPAEKAVGINVFITQLVVNFFWSLIFFNAQAYGFAFLWLILLWILILWMIILFSRVDRVAAMLQIPYLLWVTFAGYLNYGVWMLNR